VVETRGDDGRGRRAAGDFLRALERGMAVARPAADAVCAAESVSAMSQKKTGEPMARPLRSTLLSLLARAALHRRSGWLASSRDLGHGPMASHRPPRSMGS